jgi:YD repeat-containing protein
MKLKSRFLPAMLVFGVVALSSCEKGEKEAAQPSFDQGTLSHVMMDSSEVTSYQFAGKQLHQVNYYNRETGEVESFEKYERDNKGRLVKTTTYAGKSQQVLSEEAHTYSDKGALEKSTSTFFAGGKPDYRSYTTYAYDAAKKLEKKAAYAGTEQEGSLKSFTTYEALPNGNYGQEKQFVVDKTGAAKLYSTTTHSYDANPNPFHAFAEPGTASSPNNLVRSSTVIHNSNKTLTKSYTYKYDESGYPISQTMTLPNGKTQTFTYLYSR